MGAQHRGSPPPGGTPWRTGPSHPSGHGFARHKMGLGPPPTTSVDAGQPFVGHQLAECLVQCHVQLHRFLSRHQSGPWAHLLSKAAALYNTRRSLWQGGMTWRSGSVGLGEFGIRNSEVESPGELDRGRNRGHFREFVGLALYHPDHGYYSSDRPRFGRTGGFLRRHPPRPGTGGSSPAGSTA